MNKTVVGLILLNYSMKISNVYITLRYEEKNGYFSNSLKDRWQYSPESQVLLRIRMFVTQQMLLQDVLVFEGRQTQIAGVRR